MNGRGPPALRQKTNNNECNKEKKKVTKGKALQKENKNFK
jgi:hypothetical protein